jgi:branched-chain amino acid aminotransferase
MNRGFRYGDGFFETIRVIDGELPLIEYHLSRAKLSARTMEMTWPDEWGVSFFLDQIKGKLSESNAVIRIDFWRSGDGTYLPESDEMEFDLTVRPFNQANSVFQLNSNWQEQVSELTPVPIVVYEGVRKPVNPWSFIKSTSASFYVQAGLWLKKQEAQDLIILNEFGNICEGLTSNIILKLGDRLLTPSHDQGAIEGVFRSYLSAEFNVEFMPLAIDMLVKADEIWLTNAVHGIRRAVLT